MEILLNNFDEDALEGLRLEFTESGEDGLEFDTFARIMIKALAHLYALQSPLLSIPRASSTSPSEALQFLQAITPAEMKHWQYKWDEVAKREIDRLSIGNTSDDKDNEKRISRTFLDDLVTERTRLIEHRKLIYLVVQLRDLFDEIDVNGDGMMEWDEFTGYCVELGFVATRRQKRPLAYKYAYDNKFTDPVSKGPSMEQLYYISEKDYLIAIESGSSSLTIYDSKMKLIRVFEPPPSFGGDNYSSTSTTNASSILRSRNFEPTIGAATIRAVCYVPHKNWITLATSDQRLACFDFNSYQRRQGYHTPSQQTGIVWSEQGQMLISGGVNGALYCWDLDNKQKLGEQNDTKHKGMITTIMEVLMHKCLLTCAADGRVQMWDVTKFKLSYKGELRGGHKRSVRSMAFSQQHDLLITAGFDYEAIGWDLATRCPMLRLKGHRQSLVSVTIVTMSNIERAFTTDIGGVFKLWEIRRNILTGMAPCEQTIEVAMKPSALTFINSTRSIVAASAKIHMLKPVKQKVQQDVPVCACFNSVSLSICVAAGKNVYVYDAKTGALFNEFYDVVPHEITSLCLDHRQRKFILGTSAGYVQVHNYLNGAPMKRCDFKHDRDISSMLYCNEDKILITTGWDRKVCIYDETPREYMALLRVINRSHDRDISCVAHSHRLSLVATGSADFTVKLWDFQLAKRVSILHGHTSEIVCLKFCDPFALLLSADSLGNIFFWYVRPAQPRLVGVLQNATHKSDPNVLAALEEAAALKWQQGVKASAEVSRKDTIKATDKGLIHDTSENSGENHNPDEKMNTYEHQPRSESKHVDSTTSTTTASSSANVNDTTRGPENDSAKNASKTFLTSLDTEDGSTYQSQDDDERNVVSATDSSKGPKIGSTSKKGENINKIGSTDNRNAHVAAVNTMVLVNLTRGELRQQEEEHRAVEYERRRQALLAINEEEGTTGTTSAIVNKVGEGQLSSNAKRSRDSEESKYDDNNISIAKQITTKKNKSKEDDEKRIAKNGEDDSSDNNNSVSKQIESDLVTNNEFNLEELPPLTEHEAAETVTLLFTGDEAGVLRCWDLTKFLMVSVQPPPLELKLPFNQPGYNPRRRVVEHLSQSELERGSLSCGGRMHAASSPGGTTMLKAQTNADVNIRGPSKKAKNRANEKRKNKNSNFMITRMNQSSKSNSINGSNNRDNDDVGVSVSVSKSSINSIYDEHSTKEEDNNDNTSVNDKLNAAESSRKNKLVEDDGSVVIGIVDFSEGSSVFLDIPCLRAWTAHKDTIRSLEHIPERHCLLTASQDLSVRLWSLHGNAIGVVMQKDRDSAGGGKSRSDRRLRVPWKFPLSHTSIENVKLKDAENVLARLDALAAAQLQATLNADEHEMRHREWQLKKLRDEEHARLAFERRQAARNRYSSSRATPLNSPRQGSSAESADGKGKNGKLKTSQTSSKKNRIRPKERARVLEQLNQAEQGRSSSKQASKCGKETDAERYERMKGIPTSFQHLDSVPVSAYKNFLIEWRRGGPGGAQSVKHEYANPEPGTFMATKLGAKLERKKKAKPHATKGVRRAATAAGKKRRNIVNINNNRNDSNTKVNNSSSSSSNNNNNINNNDSNNNNSNNNNNNNNNRDDDGDKPQSFKLPDTVGTSPVSGGSQSLQLTLKKKNQRGKRSPRSKTLNILAPNIVGNGTSLSFPEQSPQGLRARGLQSPWRLRGDELLERVDFLANSQTPRVPSMDHDDPTQVMARTQKALARFDRLTTEERTKFEFRDFNTPEYFGAYKWDDVKKLKSMIVDLGVEGDGTFNYDKLRSLPEWRDSSLKTLVSKLNLERGVTSWVETVTYMEDQLSGQKQPEVHIKRQPAAVNAKRKHFGQYTIKEVLELKMMFDSMDEDGSGEVDLHEFLSSPTWQRSHLAGTASTVFNTIDNDSDGSISLTELLSITFPGAKPSERRAMKEYLDVVSVAKPIVKTRERRLDAIEMEEIQEMFNVFDLDGNGTVSVSELLETLKVMGSYGAEFLSEDDLKRIASKYDEDGDHDLNLQEFQELMKPQYLNVGSGF